VRAIVKSFRAIQAFADFDPAAGEGAGDGDDGDDGGDGGGNGGGKRRRRADRRSINLGYTINLQLPATSDIAVFNAIFKSLREHILPDS
jgi:hypothetical protein